jgi:hypothetical protein
MQVQASELSLLVSSPLADPTWFLLRDAASAWKSLLEN